MTTQGRKTISRETADHFASLLRQALEERYEGKFIFDPIEVESAIDQYGDEYLETYIVFDGDQKNLDPRWTAHLGIQMWEELERMGIFNSPAFSLRGEERMGEDLPRQAP